MRLTKKLFQSMVVSALVIGTASALPLPGRPGQRPGPSRPMPAPGPQMGQLQQVTIQLNKQYSNHSVIPLKSLIQAQHPRLNLSVLKLKKVVLIAKSQLGRGTAVLKVGQQSSYAHTVPGTPFQYRLPGPNTFSGVQLNAPFVQRSGPMVQWQVLLNGNIKVRQVRVSLGR